MYLCMYGPLSAEIHCIYGSKSNTQKLTYIAMCRFKGRVLTKIRKSSVNVALSAYTPPKNIKPKPSNDSKTTDKYRHVRAIPKQLVQFVRGGAAQWVYDFAQ